MKSLWVQDTAFPIIARAIERSYRDPEKFVSRNEIIQWLTHDTQTWKLIERAYKKNSPQEIYRTIHRQHG
jgi:hypothetical protein